MAELILGPMLRYAGTEDATIWVETDARLPVEVAIEGADACSRRTFAVQGHHYALLHCEGLQPDGTAPYEVRLDGETVWPEPDSPFPPSVVRTHSGRRGRPDADPVRLLPRGRAARAAALAQEGRAPGRAARSTR